MSKFVHRVILETTNCTVLCCSRRKSKAGWIYKEKYNRKMVRSMWLMSKMIEIIFNLMYCKEFWMCCHVD